MSESKELAVAEQPQQLITIEPKKYVELVFEPFVKQYADGVNAVRTVAYDIKTTAGMSTAIKHRAAFRDIRVAMEKARKFRKAPILEIGKLLDSRAGEIEARLLPLETMFDEEIKAEEGRKEAEKAAKAAAERERIAGIRAKVDEIKSSPVHAVGRPADEIQAAIDELTAHEITADEFQEFEDEAAAAKAFALSRLQEAMAVQRAHEVEKARLAEEHAKLARERAEAAERERIAAAARAEQERKDREAREAEERRLRAEREAHEAELRRQREAEEARLAAERERAEAEMQAKREELARQQAEIDRKRAEAERVERERREAIAAEERRRREAAEAAARAEAERIAAEQAAAAQAEADRIFAEQQRAEAERLAAEAERIRRERENFELNGPHASEMLEVLAAHYQVDQETVLQWINRWVWAQVEIAA